MYNPEFSSIVVSQLEFIVYFHIFPYITGFLESVEYCITFNPGDVVRVSKFFLQLLHIILNRFLGSRTYIELDIMSEFDIYLSLVMIQLIFVTHNPLEKLWRCVKVLLIFIVDYIRTMLSKINFQEFQIS